MIDIGIIPTRGGSSGLAHKNVKDLCGRPLISYTIEAALGSAIFSEVYVSTDCDEIETIARREGAKILRHPTELSGPTCPTAPVISWDLNFLEQNGAEIGLVATMRATSPLRTSEDIRAAANLLETSSKADSVVSVTVAQAHPARLKRIRDDGCLENAWGGEGRRPTRRQEFEVLHVRNGGIYLAKREVVSAESLWGEYCLAYEMPAERGLNINTDYDFRMAELLVQDARRSIYQTQPF